MVIRTQQWQWWERGGDSNEQEEDERTRTGRQGQTGGGEEENEQDERSSWMRRGWENKEDRLEKEDGVEEEGGEDGGGGGESRGAWRHARQGGRGTEEGNDEQKERGWHNNDEGNDATPGHPNLAVRWEHQPQWRWPTEGLETHDAEQSHLALLCFLFFFFLNRFHVPRHKPEGGLVPLSEICKYLAQISPNVGVNWGTQWQRWAATHSGGGGEWWWWEEGRGRSQCVTVMMFQPRLLDLATNGCLLLINYNYYYF